MVNCSRFNVILRDLTINLLERDVAQIECQWKTFLDCNLKFSPIISNFINCVRSNFLEEFVIRVSFFGVQIDVEAQVIKINFFSPIEIQRCCLTSQLCVLRREREKKKQLCNKPYSVLLMWLLAIRPYTRCKQNYNFSTLCDSRSEVGFIRIMSNVKKYLWCADSPSLSFSRFHFL